jgi:hypothetical protein|tara:strand:- start:2302 stop:2493 length:192 start_codon:yes stop_codon:yes gene_type:complete
MSCGKNLTVELSVHQAAAVRQELFRCTKQDSYEFPGQRTISVREVIVKLDEAIESALEHDHEE